MKTDPYIEKVLKEFEKKLSSVLGEYLLLDTLFREGKTIENPKEHRDAIFRDMSDFVTQSLLTQREEIIRSIKKWTKGRTVTKDSLRNYLNEQIQK